MAITKRKDLVIPEILVEAVQGQWVGMKALWGTGVAVVNSSLPAANVDGSRLRGGDEVAVPYFGNLGELEDVAEGDALTPVKLTMSSEKGVVQRSGKAVELTEWSQLAAQYADPYAEVARQLKEMVARRADQALIDAAGAGLPTNMIKDVTGGATKTLDWDVMTDAKMLWGDEQDDILMLAVHSKVYGDLLKLKDSTGRPLLVDMNDGTIPRFHGIPIKVSDRNTKIDGATPKYKSMILKRGALAFWFNKTPSIDTDKDILTDSQVLAVHVYWVAHRYRQIAGGSKPGVVQIVTN